MSGSIYTDEKLLRFLHRAARFTRADFDLEEPVFRKDLGRLCRINYIGPRFQRGGIALIDHSSGSAEKRGGNAFAERDKALVSKMMAFREKCSPQTLDDLMKQEGRDTQQWSLWWAISGTISRLQCDFSEIALTNLLPFTVYDAERPALARSNCPTWHKAVHDFLKPWLSATGAGTVIWLGKQGCEEAQRHWPEVPVHAVINRARDLSTAERFKDLDDKIARGVIRTGSASSGQLRDLPADPRSSLRLSTSMPRLMRQGASITSAPPSPRSRAKLIAIWCFVMVVAVIATLMVANVLQQVPS